MTGTKILWGQIVVVFAVVLVTLWAATQWTAWRLGFQPQLGPPWFNLVGVPVYLPPIFFWWWFRFDAYAPSIFLEGGAIASSGGFAAIAISIGMSVWRAREAKAVTTYGSARWATRAEVRSAGSSAQTGSCSAGSRANICVTTGRNTCSVSRRLVPARGWAWSSPHS
jgi:type IV secretion system protein VirD4